MFESWDTSTITALAAIGGSLVGALGSSVSTWIIQRHQDRRELLARKISHREQLYSDFINESAKVMIDAIQHRLEDPSKLIPIYALLSRIRLSSSMSVVESAERVATSILRTYSAPNLTPEEIQAGATGGADPLRDFSSACRAELESLWDAS
jgi:hypothetical protein